MLPKRVGLPKIKPPHSTRSSCVAYGGPSSGTGGSSFSVVTATVGTVRNRARIPGTDSIPRQIYRASAAVLPWRE